MFFFKINQSSHFQLFFHFNFLVSFFHLVAWGLWNHIRVMSLHFCFQDRMTSGDEDHRVTALFPVTCCRPNSGLCTFASVVPCVCLLYHASCLLSWNELIDQQLAEAVVRLGGVCLLGLMGGLFVAVKYCALSLTSCFCRGLNLSWDLLTATHQRPSRATEERYCFCLLCVSVGKMFNDLFDGY